MNSQEEGRPSRQEVGAQQSSRTTPKRNTLRAPTHHDVDVRPDDDFYVLTISRRSVADAVVGTAGALLFIGYIVGASLIAESGNLALLAVIAVGVAFVSAYHRVQTLREHSWQERRRS